MAQLRLSSAAAFFDWFANAMHMSSSDTTYAAWWKWTALLSYLVIFLNGTSHPVYNTDPVYRWLAVGSYTLVFLAGLWIWMGPKIRKRAHSRMQTLSMSKGILRTRMMKSR